MPKPLNELDFGELVDECAGTALMQIGAGDKFRNVVLGIVHAVSQWQHERSKPKKVDRQPSDLTIKANIISTTVDMSNPQVYTILKGDNFNPNVELVYRNGKLIDVKLIEA